MHLSTHQVITYGETLFLTAKWPTFPLPQLPPTYAQLSSTCMIPLTHSLSLSLSVMDLSIRACQPIVHITVYIKYSCSAQKLMFCGSVLTNLGILYAFWNRDFSRMYTFRSLCRLYIRCSLVLWETSIDLLCPPPRAWCVVCFLIWSVCCHRQWRLALIICRWEIQHHR
jgi:hypothetical protein